MFLKPYHLFGVIFFTLFPQYSYTQETCASNSTQAYEWPSHRNWFMAPNLYSGAIINMETMSVTSVGGPGNAVTSYEGVSAASDDNGELLFYTNGRSLWKGTGSGVTKTYGGLLTGNEGGIKNGSASQGLITVRHPLDPDRYWVITTDDAIASTKGMNAFSFDKSGNLLSGPIRLGTFRTSEAISATLHSNGIDIWVTCLASGGGNFHTYLLKCNGFDSSPVVSSIGPKVTSNRERGGISYSWDGEYLAQAHPNWWPDGDKIVSIYKFNKSTGELHDAMNVSGVWGSPYDITWSPNNKRVYVSMQNSTIHYLDISSWNTTTIKNSWTSTGVSSGFSAIEIGNDGSLYIAHGVAGGGYLKKMNGDLNTASSFNTSNVSGTAGMSHLGLPTIYIPPSDEPDIQYVGPFCTSDPPIDLSTTWICSGNDAENPVDNPLAYTGKGITDRANGIFDPSIAGPGTHEITFEYCSVNDTIWITVTSCSSCTSNLEDVQPEICMGETYSLDGLVNDASSSGVWSIDSFPLGTLPLITQPVGAIFDASNFQVEEGIYKLLYTVTNGSETCYDSVYITVNPIPVVELGNDTTICVGESVVFDPGAFNSYLWSDASEASNLTANSAGEYWVKIEDSNGCIDRDSVVLIVADLPVVDLGNDTSVCVGNTVTFDASIFNSYLWNDASKNQTLNVNTAGEYWVKIEDTNGCSDTDTVVFSNYQLPIIDLGSDTSICDDDSTITFDAREFDSYLWNDGSIESNLTTNQAGDYWVKVEDINGCADSDSIVLTINSVPQLNLGNDTIVCNGEFVIFDAGSFHSILWNDGSIDPKLLATSPMDYWVRVEDINGCVNSDTIILSAHTLPMVYLGNDTSVCIGDSVILNANVFDSYLWNDGSLDSKLKVNTAGVYWVKVEDSNGCQSNDSFELSINTLPKPDLGLDQFICEDSSGITFDPGVYNDYLWQPGGEVSQTINTNSAGQYIVQVIDENFCKGYDTVYLKVNDLPELNLGKDKTICPGSSVKLDAGSGYKSYFWSDGSIAQELTVTELNAGEFNVLVTDTNNCTDSDTIDVILSTELSVDLGKDTAFCEGGAITVDAGEVLDATYLWEPSGFNHQLTIEESGTYSVLVSDPLGCIGKDTITVVVNNNPSLEIGSDIIICQGLDTSFSVGDEWEEITWNDGTNYKKITVNIEGKYYVDVQDINGCFATDTANFNFHSKTILDIGDNRTICPGSSVEFDAGIFSSYKWQNQSTEPTYEGFSAEKVWVDVIDENGCKESDTAEIFITSSLPVDLIEDTAICSGETVLIKTGYPSESYTFNWSTNEKTKDIVVETSGKYIVTVEDESGCTGRDSLVVTVNALPVIDLGTDKEICEGFNLALDAGVKWEDTRWNTSDTTPSIIAKLEGEYSVLVTNKNGCEASDTIALIINSNPIPNLGEDKTLCAGSTAFFEAGSYANFTWHDQSTDSFYVTAIEEEVRVTVTDDKGCLGSDTVNVFLKDELVVDLGKDIDTCAGKTIELNAGYSASNYFYLWNTSEKTENISITDSGNYFVSVSDKYGCSGNDTIHVTLYQNPEPVVTDTAVCEGDFVILSTGNYAAYSWDSGEDTREIKPLTEGEYTVTVTDENQCSGTETGQLTIYSKPVIPSYETQLACEGDTITLSPELPVGSFFWRFDGTKEPSLDVHSDGYYQVIVTNPFGCKDSMILEAVFTLKPKIDLGENQFLCEGDSTTIGFYSESFPVIWENGSSENFIKVNQSGRYIASITDTIGCLNQDTIDVFVSPNPLINATNDTVVCMEEIQFLELKVSTKVREEVLWSTGESENEIIIEEEGDYGVTITNGSGCTVNETIHVQRKCTKSIFIPNGFTPNQDGINDFFGPAGVNVDALDFYVFDRWGEQVFHSSDIYTKWDGTYMGIPCQIDIYVWKLFYEGEDDDGVIRIVQKTGTVALMR